MNGFEILPSAGGGSDPLKLDLAGGTVTGQLVLNNASATGALNLAPTWNNAGTDFNLIYGRATNTSSGASSKLIDVALADGSGGFVVTKAGNIQLTGTNAYRQATIDVPGAAYGALALSLNGSAKLNITTGSIASNGVPIGSDWGGYLFLRDSGSSVTELSIKRGAGSPEGVVTANPGSIYLNSSGGAPYYKNTGTGNTGWVAADISGKLDLTGGTVTGQLVLTNASATGALNLAPTWNNAGTDFAGIYSRVTNTASGANSRLMSLGTVAGGELFGIVPNGNIMLGYDGHIKFNPGAANIGGEDVGIVRTAAGTLKVSDAGTGHGTLDVLGLAVSGAPGATYSGLVTSITVVNGIVTAVT